ncbi:hypothetical protein HYE69_10440 [Staphylococcus sp. GSSP0090]|nr:hypothetical protein [Staphylococcus sp. GSSP0090]
MEDNRLRQVEQSIESLQSKNIDEHKDEFEKVESEIVQQKVEIRNSLMPDNNQEDERIKDIANKLNEHIKTGFSEFEKADEIVNYLEPAFQRGKVDKAYGRALVLLVENTMIEQVKIHFEHSKDNARLMDFILDKLIELSSEIMPNHYTEILALEKRFFELQYSQK